MGERWGAAGGFRVSGGGGGKIASAYPRCADLRHRNCLPYQVLKLTSAFYSADSALANFSFLAPKCQWFLVSLSFRCVQSIAFAMLYPFLLLAVELVWKTGLAPFSTWLTV
jgi:hypothetical protein